MIGVYKIQSLAKPECCYIGSSKSIKVRWRLHKSDLKLNKHVSIKLQQHYNKYGLSDLVFCILITCDLDKLKDTEQYFMDTYKPYFNTCPFAKNSFGYKHTEESLEKMRAFQKGKRHSPKTEFKKGHKTWMKGKSHSEESKRKNRESHLGKKDSMETRIRKQKSAIEGWKLRKSKTI